jgi:glycosyltransferase involved in cell wall biosynthesis
VGTEAFGKLLINVNLSGVPNRNMPKIMHIITRLDMGGSAQNTLLTCRELADAYQMVLLHGLARESGMTGAELDRLEHGKRDASKRGVKLIPLGSLVRPINPVRDLLALCALLGHIRRERPDIVHTHTSKAGILGRLAARMAGVPHIVHTPHGHVFYGHFGRVTAHLFLTLEKYFASFTEKTVALTDGERKDYLDLEVGAADNILTIHSGVDVEEMIISDLDVAAKKKSLGVDPAAKLIGFAGWLLPIKGPGHLLSAMPAVLQEHPDATLVLVGKGNMEPALRQQADRLGLNEHVRFLGWREDVREIMPLFDVFVLPSLNEGMGRVLVEAMAAGRPIVASRVGGIPDVVRHGETGLLVMPHDTLSLAESISMLLRDSAQAERMGAMGRLKCREFSLQAMIAKLDALYRKLLAIQPPVRPAPIAPGGASHSSLPPSAESGDTCLPTG